MVNFTAIPHSNLLAPEPPKSAHSKGTLAIRTSPQVKTGGNRALGRHTKLLNPGLRHTRAGRKALQKEGSGGSEIQA